MSDIKSNVQSIFNITNDENYDLEIFSHLEDDGPQYLTNCLKNIQNANCKDQTIIDIFNNFHRMYLNMGDLFHDNYENYIFNAIKNNGFLLNSYTIEHNDDNEMKEHLFNMINESRDILNTKKIINFYRILTESKFIDILDDDELWNKSDVENDHFLGILINRIGCTQNSIDSIFSVIINLLKKNNLKNRFIKFCTGILNSNIGRENSILFAGITKNTNKFLNILLLIILKVYFFGHSEKRSKTINPDYIISKHCNIKWASQSNDDSKDDSKYNFTTESFYLLLHAIRTCFVPLLSIYKRLKRESMFFSNVSTQSTVKQKIKEIKSIIYDKYTLRCIDEFYEILSYVIVENKISNLNINDDIFNDMSMYLLNRFDNNYEIKNDNLIKLLTRIIGTDEYISNPYIRTSYISIVGLYIENKFFDIDNEEFKNNIIEGLINIFIFLEKHSDNISSRLKIAKLFTYLGKNFDSFNIDNLVQNKTYKMKKFLLYVLNACSTTLDISLKFIESINNMRNNIFISNIISKKISALKSGVSAINQYVDIILFLSKCSNKNEILNMLLSDELKHCFVSTINRLITEFKFDGKYFYMPNVLTPGAFVTNNKVSTEKLIIKLMKTCVNFENKDLLDALIKNIDYFDLDNYTLIASNDKMSTKLGDSYPKFLNNLLQTIYNSSFEEDNKDNDVEIPDEFIDPMICTLIKDPIMLPKTKPIFERSSIVRWILQNEIHPMTKEKLTIELLDEFNNQNDIKEKITNFNNKLNEWKSKNNIK